MVCEGERERERMRERERNKDSYLSTAASGE